MREIVTTIKKLDSRIIIQWISFKLKTIITDKFAYDSFIYNLKLN